MSTPPSPSTPPTPLPNPNPNPLPNPLLKSHIRIARPTPCIPSLLSFYTSGLGFSILSSFSQHAGFDGVMLGHPGLAYHLEFTSHTAQKGPVVPQANHNSQDTPISPLDAEGSRDAQGSQNAPVLPRDNHTPPTAHPPPESFTRAGEGGSETCRAPSQDNLLVFYIPEKLEWETAVKRMENVGVEGGVKGVRSANPFWDHEGRGRVFEDVDGWRVVLWCGGWGV